MLYRADHIHRNSVGPTRHRLSLSANASISKKLSFTQYTFRRQIGLLPQYLNRKVD